MKKLFTFMMALLAILLPIGNAQAQGSIEIPIGGTTTTTLQLTIKWNRLNGEVQSTPRWLAMSPFGEAYTVESENDPGIYAHWNVETTDIMWDAATAGKNAGTGTYPMFRLRNAATGIYLKQNSNSGLNPPKDFYWEFELRPTTDANEALLFALVPKSGFGNEGNTYPEGSYVLMTNTMVQGYAASLGCDWFNWAWVPLITGRKYENEDWATWDHNNVAVSCTNTDVEVVEDLAKLYNQLKDINMANYPKGNELGQYKASAVDAFTNVLNDPDMLESITDLDGDRSDDTAWGYITKLHAAYVDLLQSKNKPILNGYYRLVNDTQHFWDGDRWDGVQKAMCWRIEEGCPSLWWDDLDKNDMSQIWKISYNEATGKYDMACLDSYYRIDTDYNYEGEWQEHIFLATGNNGQMDIEYVDSPEGEPVFYIKTSGQYYNQPVHTTNHLGMWTWYPDGCYDKYRVTTHGGYDRWYIQEVSDMHIESNYTLADGTHYTNNSPIYAQEFHYTRELKNTSLQAMYVPASLPVETFTDQGVSVYYLNDNHAYFDASGNLESMTMEVVPITSGTLIANTPYVIKASETGKKDFVAHDVVVYPAEEKSVDCSSTTYQFTFTGTNQPISASELRQNEYYFFSGGGLKQIGTNSASLGAQRWYLNIESRGPQYSPKPAEVKVRILGDDDWDETGIQFAEEEVNKKSEVYDITGRKVALPTQSGLYIVNGRKVLVK